MDCFFGVLREPTCADMSYVLNRDDAVAGTPSGFDIVAADCFGNRRINGGDTWNVIIVENGAPVPVTVRDNGDGTYRVTYTLYTACQECVSVRIFNSTTGGFAVQNTPFLLSVRPSCPVYLNISISNPSVFVVYDEWGNLATTATEADFVSSSFVDLETGIRTPVAVASLDCNGTFLFTVPDVVTNCSRYCIRSACPASQTIITLHCVAKGVCNMTSWIFFSDTGTRIDFLLAEPVPQLPPAFYGEFDCCLLVVNCILLGDGAYCVFRNETTFQAFLPPNATVCSAVVPACLNAAPPAYELFLDCTPLNVTGGACSVPLVTQRLVDPAPVVRVAAPQLLAACAPFLADAAATTNAGGRPGFWTWQLVGVTPPLGDDNSAAIASAVAVQHGATLLLPGGLLRAGFTYTFRATLTNHLDQSGSATFSVAVVPVSTGVTMFVSPVPPVSISPLLPQGYHAFVVNDQCDPAASRTIGEVDTVVTWVPPPAVAQREFLFVANRTVNQNALELPPVAFSLQSPDAFIDVASLSSASECVRGQGLVDWSTASSFTTLATASVHVRVVPQRPYVYVAQGTERVFVLGDAPLLLNVSYATNFNADLSPLSFEWSCVDLRLRAPCFSPQTSVDLLLPQRAIMIPATALTLQWYVFSVRVTSGGMATVLDTRIRTNSTGPDVTVDWYSAAADGATSVSRFDRFCVCVCVFCCCFVMHIHSLIGNRDSLVSITGNVTRDLRFGPVRKYWTATSGNIALTQAAGDVDSVLVQEGGAGAQYSVRLTAEDQQGVSWAQYTWVANDRPNGGRYVLSALLFVTLTRSVLAVPSTLRSTPISFSCAARAGKICRATRSRTWWK